MSVVRLPHKSTSSIYASRCGSDSFPFNTLFFTWKRFVSLSAGPIFMGQVSSHWQFQQINISPLMERPWQLFPAVAFISPIHISSREGGMGQAIIYWAIQARRTTNRSILVFYTLSLNVNMLQRLFSGPWFHQSHLLLISSRKLYAKNHAGPLAVVSCL